MCRCNVLIGVAASAAAIARPSTGESLKARRPRRRPILPAIVTLVSVVIVMFLMAYVVPQVAGVFAGSKRALPLLTVLVLGFSEGVRSYGWVLLGVFLMAVAVARLALKHEAVRERFDARLLTLPWLGRMARDYNAARFAGTLAMLTAAGVPLLKGLQAAAETLSNHAMRADARDAIMLVREGVPLASAMAKKTAFPGCSVCSRAWASRPASCR